MYTHHTHIPHCTHTHHTAHTHHTHHTHTHTTHSTHTPHIKHKHNTTYTHHTTSTGSPFLYITRCGQREWSTVLPCGLIVPSAAQSTLHTPVDPSVQWTFTNLPPLPSPYPHSHTFRCSVWLSTAPFQPLTHWYQIRLLLLKPVFLHKDQELSGHLRLVANER